MNNKNIIIFSSIDWNMHKQLHQQLTYSLLENRNRILFIENSGVRRAKLSDFPRLLKRLKDWSKSTGGYTENIKNLTILVSLLFPFPYSKIFTSINKYIINSKINKWLKLSKISKPIIITFLPSPLIHNLINSIDYELLIYYCANNMSKGSKHSLPLKYWEDLMFKKSDIVISISNNITKRAKLFNLKVKKVSPGVDNIFFQKQNKTQLSDMIAIEKPIIGYVGSISDVIDYDLIEFLINELNHISFVFVGPIYTSKIKRFANNNNIYFIGGKAHYEIPHYINTFNATIIPYLVNDFTNSVYSCKLNEYLACGKPVISTSIDENLEFNNNNPSIIYISKTKESFRNNILNALEKDSYLQISARKEVAKINSWDNRFKELNKYINDQLALKEKQNLANDRFAFLSLYKKSRFFINRSFLTTFVIIFIVFYSPLFWILGNNLNTYDQIEKSDSIVVFSGNDKKYSDQDYLNLVLKAKKLYDKKISKKIILLSGKEQSIKEVEIMKLFLVNRGVPNNEIFIFENYPNSTFKGISMINEFLNKNNISKIIYISSKYHNLRSKLIWNKNFPNKEIILLKTKNEKQTKKIFFWFSNYEDIKVIIYEYLSIIYNKILGRL